MLKEGAIAQDARLGNGMNGPARWRFCQLTILGFLLQMESPNP
jgi:hypothetical protein